MISLRPSIFYGLILAALSALSYAQEPEKPATPPRPSGRIEVNRIAATVNGSPITAKEVGILLAPEVARLSAEFPRRGREFETQLKEIHDKVLQELIDRELIMGEFKKKEAKGASLPESVIQQEIKRQVMSLYNGNYDELRRELAKAHMSMASYEKLTRNKMIVQAMRQDKFKDAPPPLPGEIQAEYNSIKDSLRDTSQDVLNYRKIFLPRMDPENPLTTPEDQLNLADKIVKQLKDGEDFAELAKEHSGDAFAEEGGLQEDVPRTDLSPEFAAILFKAEPGTVIGPLEDPAGFTIARVESIIKGPPPPLNAEVRELMDQRVRAHKTSERYDRWIENLRRSAVIDIKIR